MNKKTKIVKIIKVGQFGRSCGFIIPKTVCEVHDISHNSFAKLTYDENTIELAFETPLVERGVADEEK